MSGPGVNLRVQPQTAFYASPSFVSPLDRMVFDLPFELPRCLSVSPHNDKPREPDVIG